MVTLFTSMNYHGVLNYTEIKDAYVRGVELTIKSITSTNTGQEF